MTVFTRVDRTTVSDTVIDQITALIRRGELKPGDRLPSEHGLSQLLGVGRSSIREAMKVLEAMGLIRRGPDGSFVSDDFSSGAMSKVLYTELMARQLDIIHLYEARQLLETHLGVLAAANVGDEDLEDLERLCEAMERTPDDRVLDHVKLDREFHARLCEIAGNPVLNRLWELAFAVLFEIRQSIPFTPADIRNSDRRHRALLEALRSRDPERVRKTIAETLEGGQRMLVGYLTNGAGTNA